MPTKTQAIVISEKGGKYQIKDVILDDPEEDELLIRVVACGICHTDIAIQQGAFPSPYPTTIGHEGSGIVESVGSGIIHFQPGDSVLLSFASCSTCGACRSGKPTACPEWTERNFGRKRGVGVKPGLKGEDGESDVWGSFFGQSTLGRMALVSASSCVKVAKDTDLKKFSPLGCGMQTGAGAVFNTLKPPSSASIAIFGCGAVGMSSILASAALNVSTIIAVDLVQSRLDLAKTFGATHTFLASDQDILDKIRQLTKWKAGVEYAVDATGNVKALKMAYECMAPFGHLCSCGTPGPGHQPPFDIHDMVCEGKTYSGVLEGGSNPPEFIPFLMDLHEKGKFPLEKMSKQFKFEDFDEAIHAMHSGKVIKPIIVFD